MYSVRAHIAASICIRHFKNLPHFPATFTFSLFSQFSVIFSFSKLSTPTTLTPSPRAGAPFPSIKTPPLSQDPPSGPPPEITRFQSDDAKMPRRRAFITRWCAFRLLSCSSIGGHLFLLYNFVVREAQKAVWVIIRWMCCVVYTIKDGFDTCKNNCRLSFSLKCAVKDKTNTILRCSSLDLYNLSYISDSSAISWMDTSRLS